MARKHIFFILVALIALGCIYFIALVKKNSWTEEYKFVVMLSLIGFLFFGIPFFISYYQVPFGYSIYSERYVIFSFVLLRAVSMYFAVLGVRFLILASHEIIQIFDQNDYLSMKGFKDYFFGKKWQYERIIVIIIILFILIIPSLKVTLGGWF